MKSNIIKYLFIAFAIFIIDACIENGNTHVGQQRQEKFAGTAICAGDGTEVKKPPRKNGSGAAG